VQTSAIQVFFQTFGAVGGVVTPIVLGVVMLTLFFQFVGLVGRLFGGREAEVSALRIRGVLDEQTRVTVHLASGSTYEHVRLLGRLQSASGKGEYSLGLDSMFVLEHPDGARTVVREKQIKLIEVPPGLIDSRVS
jgi:hypothetical protein